MTRNDPIKLIVTIVPRGGADHVVENFQAQQIGIHHVSLGFGTANSEILDYLGIGETEKDVLFSLAPSSKAKEIMDNIDTGMSLHLPGRGIIFILPLNAVSKVVQRTLHSELEDEDSSPKEAEEMENQAKYSLVMAIIDRGHVDTVMDAAKAAGAGGGTVIHARGLGSEAAGKFIGITLQPEKDVVMLLVRQKNKVEIMNAVGKAAGMRTDAHGILFSLPVEDFSGIS